MSSFDERASESKCCGCDEIVGENGEHVNMVMLPKQAEWDHPTMGNVVHDIPSEYATAIMCDECMEYDTDPMYAVKGKDLERVPIDDLEDITPMSERIED